MGTTLTAAQAGSLGYTLVAAIEGYENLLTDGSTSAVVTAWAGTEWSAAQAGLTVVGDWSQQLDPWNPFPSCGTLSLSIHPDSGDTLAVAIFKQVASSEGFLSADWSASSVTANLISTAELAASGTAYIGTERFTYTGKTGTTLTGCTRGRYSPFSTNSGTANQFGRAHRVTDTEESTIIRPIVSQDPRVWVGRWVGVWMHRNVGGVLDVKAQAQLIYAGRITEIRDNPTTGYTDIQVQHVAECIADATVGKDCYTAELAEGVYIDEGAIFYVVRSLAGGVKSESDHLVCVTGASGYSEIEPGYYSVEDICSFLNDWSADENLKFTIASPVATSDGPRTIIHWKLNDDASATKDARFTFFGPGGVIRALGWEPGAYSSEVSYIPVFQGKADVLNRDSSIGPPIRYDYSSSQATARNITYYLQNESGTPTDQRDFIPAGYQGWIEGNDPDGDYSWVVLRIGEQFILGGYDDGVLYFARTIKELGPVGRLVRGTVYHGDGPEKPTMRQVFVLAGSLQSLLPRIFASTGTAAYNHADYDVLGYSMGLGIPWSLLGTPFVNSLRKLDGAGVDLVLVVEKPTTIRELLGPDLILRRAGLVWKNEGLRFSPWQTPKALAADHTLTESNKAAPPGTDTVQASPVTIVDQWQRSTVKLKYNRDARTGEYRDSLTLQDAAAIDDAGGEDRPITISLPNSYAKLGSDDDEGFRRLAKNYLAGMPLFSRPARLLRRSIDHRYFENVAPGDIVSITDSFARDPSTGLRGITNAAGIIVAHRCDWGGGTPGDPTQVRNAVGEVTIMLVDRDRSGKYSPAAQIDNSYSSNGFTNGYKAGTLQIHVLTAEHQDTGVSSATDASWFAASDAVTVYEIDPADPAAPQSWDRTISTVSGLDVTLSSALTGYDTSKKYRMVSQAYASAQSTQKTYAYQADNADSRIQDVARPFTYGHTNSPSTVDNDDADLPERHATLMYGDGKPVDPGATRGIIRMVNNLKRTKTKLSTPAFWETYQTGNPTTGTWDLLFWRPIRIPAVEGNAGSRRTLKVAPFWCSSDGTATELRVSLSAMPPAPADPSDIDDNPVISRPRSQATWSTSSTTFAEGAVAELDLGPAEESGIGWLIIEGKEKARTYGLSKCYESRSGKFIHELDWCKNGDVPQAALEERLRRELNAVLRRPKEVFAWCGVYNWSNSNSGARTRWRFACHTGTHTARFAVLWVMAPITASDSVNRYAKGTLYTKIAGGATTSMSVAYGSTDFSGSQRCAPDECFIGTRFIDCDPDTDYECYFEEDDYARIVGAVVYECGPQIPARTDYPTGSFAALGPIYDSHREDIYPVATNAWKRNGSQLFNWSVDMDATPRSTSSATAKNLIDDSSTAVSAATPGFTIDLEYAGTLAQTTVPCVFKVWGQKTSSGNGTVTLKDSGGSTVATVTITSGAGLAWYSTTVNLPASVAKYDIHYARATAGACTVSAVSLYQYMA